MLQARAHDALHALHTAHPRWQEGYEAIHLEDHPARPLTKPVKVFDFDWSSATGAPHPEAAAVQLEVVAPGCLSGVVFWFDLQLGPNQYISSGEQDSSWGLMCVCMAVSLWGLRTFATPLEGGRACWRPAHPTPTPAPYAELQPHRAMPPAA